MKNHLFYLFFLLSFISFSQNQQKIDSLKSLLKPTEINIYQAQLNLDISNFYINSSRDTCKIYAKKAEKIALSIKNKALLNKIYLQLGIINYKQQKDVPALNYFNKIDSLHNLNNTFSEAYFMTKIYRSEISKFKFTMQGVMQAKKYLLEALALAKKQNDKRLINLVKYRLAEWHGFISQEVSPKAHLDTAKSYIKNIIPYYKAKNDYGFLAKLYHTLASIAMERKNYKYAESNYIKRLHYKKKMKNPKMLGEAYFSLGSFYRKLKKPDKGLSYLDSASVIFKKTGFSSDGYQKDLYKEYAYLYEEKKDYKKAFNSIHKAFVLKDKIYEQENTKKAMELEKKYQTQKKEHQIALLKSQKKYQQYLLLSGIGLTTLVGLFFFFLYRNRQKTTLKLRELDKIKSNIFANISHEFRTPLTLISSPIQQKLNDDNLPENDRKAFKSIKRNADRLLILVNQLLDIPKIESGNLKLKVAKNDIISFLNLLTEGFSYAAAQKEINFNTTVNPTTIKTWFDNDVLEKIASNLLSNAVKYTPNKGSIICNAFVKENKLHFEVKNTGKGILPNQIPKIFDRFYQTEKNSKGIGIGLALVKELIAIHKGKISVKSTPNKWTTFKFTIPINKKSFNETEIIKKVKSVTTVSQTEFYDTQSNNTTNLIIDETNENPILLIVEDNTDLNSYIKDLFSENYAILQAKDGKEGIELAFKYIPDVIISDIMMPIKDGVTLCNTLKIDKRTNHIPIILLTAKAGDKNEIEGIKVGADAYITKPFNNNILKLKVDKLLESRKKLQLRYSQEVILKPADIAINSIDELFLEHVQEVLDTNLVESSFHINEFSKAVGMSRMQLHRKLKTLTGLTTSEFICSQRLKLATQLLKTSDINISQVGYSVGFNNHAYFSKCFKEAYKCSPTAYARKNK